MLALEINDAGLVIARNDAVLAVEPGYAFGNAEEIQTGWPAYRQARLHPKRVSNAHWRDLSLERVEPGFPAANNAEIAYVQIAKLWQEFGEEGAPAVLIVPAHFRAQQLGLLLGMAQEAGVNVRAMVQSAVAAALRPYPGRQLVYLDADLHRVAVTVIEQASQAVAGPTSALDTIGLSAVVDSFAKRFGEAFVLGTRFDPLHNAASEQNLYDRMPQWLAELREAPSVDATVTFGDEEFTVELPRERVLVAASGFFRAVVQLVAQSRQSANPLVVLVSNRLAMLPGLQNELSRLDDAEIVFLEEGHAALSMLARLDDIDITEGPVRLIKSLPWHAAPAPMGSETMEVAANGPRENPQSHAVPTHIVYRGIGYRLDDGGLLVGRARTNGHRGIVLDDAHSGVSSVHCEIRLSEGELRLADLSRYGTYVNDQRVDGEIALQCADVIRIGSPGAELQVIRIES